MENCWREKRGIFEGLARAPVSSKSSPRRPTEQHRSGGSMAAKPDPDVGRAFSLLNFFASNEIRGVAE